MPKIILLTGAPSSSGPRHCYGAGGTAAGSITVPGSGDWTIARASAGLYTVTFNVPFTTQPAISADVVSGNLTNHGVYIVSYALGSVVLQTETSNAAADLEFHFIAVGT